LHNRAGLFDLYTNTLCFTNTKYLPLRVFPCFSATLSISARATAWASPWMKSSETQHEKKLTYTVKGRLNLLDSYITLLNFQLLLHTIYAFLTMAVKVDFVTHINTISDIVEIITDV